MQITCRLLNQETFTVDATVDTTVTQLKQKIEEKKGAGFRSDWLKLIYAGKVLEDSNATLKQLNISDSGFVVVMINKKPPARSDEGSSASALIQPTSAVIVQNPEPQERPHAPPPALQHPTWRPEEAFGLSPEQYENLVQQLMQMGYPKVDVERALYASFYNADRAVEYLLTGIPGSSADLVELPAENQQLGRAQNEDPLAFFRASPQFAQMQAMIQQDPQSLGSFLQQIGQSNPQLFQAIRDNQEAFLAMINAQGGSAAAVASPTVQNPTNQQGTRTVVRVTAEERESIERLKALGFTEQMVLEAFIACDKNEALAADFLFSQLEEFEQGGGGPGPH